MPASLTAERHAVNCIHWFVSWFISIITNIDFGKITFQWQFKHVLCYV